MAVKLRALVGGNAGDMVMSMAPDEQMLLIEGSQSAGGRPAIYADE